MHFKTRFCHTIHQALKLGGFLFLILTFFHTASHAQSEVSRNELSFDEKGKYIYYETLTGNEVPNEELLSRAQSFFKTNQLKGIVQKENKISALGKFVINKTAYVLSHPSGEVSYQIFLEVKDDKYRFWLSDYAFKPYRRDRYANFVPVSQKAIPLETEPAKFSKSEWASYIEATNTISKTFATAFSAYLRTGKKPVPKTEKTKKTINTKSW